MKNYAKALPRDKDGGLMSQYPAPASALGVYGSENATASSVISLTNNTTAIEVAVVGTGVVGAVLRWVGTADTQASVISAAGTANFDHAIPLATGFRRFVVPIESMPQTAPSIAGGANTQNGLYRRVAIKSIGVASVLLSEF